MNYNLQVGNYFVLSPKKIKCSEQQWSTHSDVLAVQIQTDSEIMMRDTLHLIIDSLSISTNTVV